MTIKQWLMCGMCCEVKGGLLLLLISKPLLLWGAPATSSIRWRVGIVLFWLSVACLVYGLLRDFRILATTKFDLWGSSKKTGD